MKNVALMLASKEPRYVAFPFFLSVIRSLGKFCLLQSEIELFMESKPPTFHIVPRHVTGPDGQQFVSLAADIDWNQALAKNVDA
jgi:hypothetical protein